MKKKAFALFSTFAVLLAFSPASAARPEALPPAGLPANAVEIAPNVYSLGTKIDPTTGKRVHGLAFVHVKANNAKPDNPGGGHGHGNGGDSTSTCYQVLAKGAVWKNVEDYTVDTSNGVGLGADDITSNLAAGIVAWETAADFNIFGSGNAGAVDGADEDAPDGVNEVLFGDLGSGGTIAVTTTWGVYGGPPHFRELTEWDMVFNEQFSWNVDGNPDDMDFLNIATHELGHALGLGHPSDSCTEETMYRFAGFGETKKQTLEAGDIAGVNELY